MRTVVVTGLGILSAAGPDLPATIRALRDGRSGLSTLRGFDSPRNGHLPVAEVAEIAGLESRPRTLALAHHASVQAIAQASLGPALLGRAGLALGTCVGGMPETESALADARSSGHSGNAAAIDPAVLARHECGYTSHALAEEWSLGGPVTTLSTACSSSAQAIALAADLVRTGTAEVMLAGGADALCRLTLNGFASLLNVSATGCQPFDRQRSGMSLGEAAAFLVLECAEHAAGRSATPLAVLAGHGNSCDAHHPTAPHPDGLGAEAAMGAALEMAGIAPAVVDYVNAHGTGTINNDAAEGRALHRLFAGQCPPVSSTKRVFGHTLGAAGAVEAIVAILAIREGFLPGTPGLAEIDPECRIAPLTTTVDRRPSTVLSNSFGFGGNNSSLCFRAAESPP